MAQKICKKWDKQTNILIYIYKTKSFTLVHIFNWKQYIYNTKKIYYKTLYDCIDLGILYLDLFFFFLDLLEIKIKNIYILNLDQIKTLIKTKQQLYNLKYPVSKTIFAEFKNNASKNLKFDFLNYLAKYFKSHYKVIKKYIQRIKSGYSYDK